MCAGDPVLHLCPAGYYCDGIPGSDFIRGAGPRPCPLYTYRASPGAGSKGDCMPCPPGSHCNSTGLKHSISHSSYKSPLPSISSECTSNSSTKMIILWHLCYTRLTSFHLPTRTSRWMLAIMAPLCFHTIKTFTVCYTKSVFMQTYSILISVFICLFSLSQINGYQLFWG